MSKLTDTTTAKVRFSEVDALGIVWHGNYVKYLEDGRESFGRRYGLSYNDVYENGLLTPIVKMEMDYKVQLHHDEEIIIETGYEACEAAKIIFNYRILRKKDQCLVMTARSVQVFLNKEAELELTNPPFYREWKEKMGVALPGS